MVNVGIIGTGRMGRIHTENIQKRIKTARVSAVADLSMDDDMCMWAKSQGIEKTYSDYRDLLNDILVDAIIIATPAKTHKQISLDAIAAKKHIFCEKPIDLDLGNIQEIIEALEGANVKYQIGFNRRFDPDYLEAKRSIERGLVGKLYIVKLSSKDMAPPSYDYIKSSGGLIFDSAIHEIDLLRFFMGQEVEEVYATGSALINPEIGTLGDTDIAAITLKMSGGGFGVIDIARKSPAGADRRIEIFGEKCILSVRNQVSDLIETTTSDGHITAVPTDGFVRFKSSWCYEIEAFITAIKNDLEATPNVFDGLESIVVATAANISLSENRPVKTSEVLYR